MGAVFAANHELLHQRVAIKVLSPDVVAEGEVVTRFLNEARGEPAPLKPPPKRKHDSRPAIPLAPHATGAAPADDLPDQSRQ